MYENQAKFPEKSRVNIHKSFAKISKCSLFLKVFFNKKDKKSIIRRNRTYFVKFIFFFISKIYCSQNYLRKYMRDLEICAKTGRFCLLLRQFSGETDTPGSFPRKFSRKRSYCTFITIYAFLDMEKAFSFRHYINSLNTHDF